MNDILNRQRVRTADRFKGSQHVGYTLYTRVGCEVKDASQQSVGHSVGPSKVKIQKEHDEKKTSHHHPSSFLQVYKNETKENNCCC